MKKREETKNEDENKVEIKDKRVVTVSKASLAYNLMTGLKISTLDRKYQFSVLRATDALSKIVEPFNKFVNNAREGLKPEGWDAIIGKIRRKEVLTEEDNETIRSYDSDVDECVSPEAEKQVSLDDYGMDDEGFTALISANGDLNVGKIMVLLDVFGCNIELWRQ